MTEFESILAQIQTTHDKKQADYGREGDPFSNVRASEDFGIAGWMGCMVRANDKMRRIQKFSKDEVLLNESIEDSLLDLAVYTIIALVLYRESHSLSALPVLEYLVGEEEVNNRPELHPESLAWRR